MSNNLPSFRSILTKIEEAQEKGKLTELFGGMGTALGKRLVNAVRPTATGAAKRDLDRQADNVLTSWFQYKASSNVQQTGDDVTKWLEYKLNVNPKIIASAKTNFVNKYPAAGEKLDAGKMQLDKYDLLNLFHELLKANNTAQSAGEDNQTQPSHPQQPTKPVQPKKATTEQPMKHNNKPLGAEMGSVPTVNQ